MDIHIFKIHVYPLREKLQRMSLKMLKDDAEAEDTVQEVMLRLWVMRDRLSGYRSIEALAIQIGKNICLNKIRSRKHQTDDSFDNFQAPTPAPDVQAEEADSVEVVAKIIEKLPDLQRIIIRLRDIEGYQPEEIAEITGCNESAVRVNLSRARKKVREEFFRINHIQQP